MNEPTTLDTLGQDAQAREVSVMLAKDGPIAIEKLDEVRRSAGRYVKRQGYPLALVAQKLGSNTTYISNFLSGKFDDIPSATLQKLARDINEWTEKDFRRVQSGGGSRFVQTLVAKRLLNVARRVEETGDIGIAHAPAGSGKTCTLLELQKALPGSVYCYVTPDAAKKSGFLRMLYEAVWEHRGPARPTLTDVLDRLRFSDRLVMLDNADLIEPSVYPVLMALHDVAKVPILLVGTHRLVEKLAFDRDPLRGQMASRVGIRAELLREATNPRGAGRPVEWISADELRAMFETPRVKLHPSAIPALKLIANHEIGRLRRVERVLRYCCSLAGERTGTVLVDAALVNRSVRLVDGDAAPARVLEAAAATELAAG